MSSVSVCGGGEDPGKGDEASSGAVDAADTEAMALECEVSSRLSAYLAGGTILRAGRDIVWLHWWVGSIGGKKTLYLSVRKSRTRTGAKTGAACQQKTESKVCFK